MFRFDPDGVAWLEAEGWRAYYDRRWGRVLRLLIILCQEQFHIPFPVSLAAAFHATWAARSFAPVEHDTRAVEAAYARFYRLARRYSGLQFDPDRVARLELEYNVVHRRLVGASDKSAFVDTLTRLHAALFGLTPQQARESAEQRVLACDAVDRITGGQSTDLEADWARVRAALQRCYRSIQAQLASDPSVEPDHADRPVEPDHAAPIDQGRAYAFTSIWEVEAPIESVWEAISAAERWPAWWSFVRAVRKLAPGDAQGVGAVYHLAWTTRLPYTFAFESRATKVEPPHTLEAVARGDLNGTGRWTLARAGSATRVQYDWHVRTRAGWMNALAPLLRPAFAWNHAVVMRSGGEGLGRLLGARVHVRT